MEKPQRVRGDAFGRALCAHFGLPASQVVSGMKVLSSADGLFGVVLELSLTADDLAGIADRMDGRTRTTLG